MRGQGRVLWWCLEGDDVTQAGGGWGGQVVVPEVHDVFV